MAKQLPDRRGRHANPETIAATPKEVLAEYAALRFDYNLVAEPDRLAVQDAAIDINRKHRRVLTDMIAIGRRLAEVRQLLPHGTFLAWLRAEFDLSQRTAYNMMGAGAVYNDDTRLQRVANLSERAVYLLAAESTPEPARVEVEEQIERTGKPLTSIEVRQVIARHLQAEGDVIDALYRIGAPADRASGGGGGGDYGAVEEQPPTNQPPRLPAPLPVPSPTTTIHNFIDERRIVLDIRYTRRLLEAIERGALVDFLRPDEIDKIRAAIERALTVG